jgi:hypothetical protein
MALDAHEVQFLGTLVSAELGSLAVGKATSRIDLPYLVEFERHSFSEEIGS